MTILGLALMAYNIVGTGFSIAGGINHAIRHFCKTTAEDLFKESFEKVVKQNASNFADLTDPKKVRVDPHTFDNIISSLKDVDEIQFTQLNESDKVAKITTLFRKCIIIPDHQLTDRDIDHRIRPIIESVIVDFYAQLPFKEDAFNQVVLEFLKKNTSDQKITHSMLMEAKREIEQVRLDVSKRLTEDIQAIKDHTEKIKHNNKEIMPTTGAILDEVRRNLEETEHAADFARQTLKKNPTNTDAYVILIGIAKEEETLDEVIAKVPDHLHDSPQIAYAISNLARQRGNYEAAKRWGEIMVVQDQENAPDFKAAFANILIEQVLEDNLAVGISQLYKAQKEQLQQAIGLLTEAWDCLSNTELRNYKASWIIDRGIAHFHLGELTKATEDFDTALEIEKANPILIKNRALLAFECGDIPKAVELLEKIQSAPEAPEVPIILANILFASECLDEAIAKLNDFLKTNPSSELEDDANRLLVRIYIAAERIKEAEQILTPMLESSPTSVLNLINAALFSNKIGKGDKAISHLKEAYGYAQDSKDFLEIVELAAELFINKQFKEATTLYEKLADTSQNSQLTQWLVQSYYNSGEIEKALKICQRLRKKYGPLENISAMEVVIYEEIGNMSQAESVCKEYLKKFPNDNNMQIRLEMVLLPPNKEESNDKERFKSATNKGDQHHEYIFKIEKLYKKKNITIGGFTSLVGSNSLDTWGTLMGNPKLGIRCSNGDIEERTNTLNLLNHSQPKLVVDIISLITLHCLDAADIVVSAFGKLSIAQSTIDELQNVIIERESMWSKREGIIVGKKGDRYVKQIINPEETKQGIEYLKNIVQWIRENCEVGKATAGSEMNQLRRREVNDMLQPHFLDTVLLASQPEYLLFSDDGRLRQYAKTSLNSDAGTNFQIEGVWTQVLLDYCVKQNILDKTDYDEMTIKLVCSRYYHTQFDADLLMEVAKRTNWKLHEPYNSFVLALGKERMNSETALDVSTDFLFTLWDESISFRQKEFLTLGLLTGLTYGRNAHTVLNRFEYLIQNKHRLFLPIENSILRQIRNFQQICPLEDNFTVLEEYDIRVKGTRVGIETILYEYIHNNRPPEVIANRYYHSLTVEQVYATILYYLQNQEKVGTYLEDYLNYCKTAQEEYEKNPPPGVVRLRKLIAEKKANSDIPDPTNPEKDAVSTTQSPTKNERG